MKLHMVGCSHHNTPVDLREQLAFTAEQARDALARWRERFPGVEAVLLSTCNRVEFYAASDDAAGCPAHAPMVEFLGGFHDFDPSLLGEQVSCRSGRDAVQHLFTVAASLDSMVVGEAQILSQVKQAYQLASECESAGPVTHAAFQAAIRAAKRVAHQTTIQRRRVSIPSVAISDFAAQIFERFDDKFVLVIGAGEMGEETLRYLIDQGAERPTIVNRSPERAERLAAQSAGRAEPWERLDALLVQADLVIGTTGADEPIVSLARYRSIAPQRQNRPLFVLDLAVPRDFDPAVGQCEGVYLYSIEDLRGVCEANRKAREKEWPKAKRIIDEETDRFLADSHLRQSGPVIRRLKARANLVKEEELTRLLNKLGPVDSRTADEIHGAFERLVNKVLHPPLESLRDEAQNGAPHGLLEALKRLFQLKD